MPNLNLKENYDSYDQWQTNYEKALAQKKAAQSQEAYQASHNGVPYYTHNEQNSIYGNVVDPRRVNAYQQASMNFPKNQSFYCADPFYQNRLLNDGSNFDKNAELLFDGTSISLYKDGKEVQSWPAQSGNSNYQDAQFMSVPHFGPLPEGRYIWNVPETQSIHDLGLKDKALNAVDEMFRTLHVNKSVGKWPGGKDAWGERRGPLAADVGTDTMGRGGLFMHGGKNLGSAGCIDVGQNMNNVYEAVKGYKTIPVNVYYPGSFSESEVDLYTDR